MLDTRPSVRIEAGPRAEPSTHVSMEEWEGPLGLLLSLIESRRLDVLTVPLGALAESYLDALASIEVDRIGSISSFVAVASQLILIKSRAMLPRAAPAESASPDADDDAPDPEAELRSRLILYRAYRDAGLALQAIADVRIGVFRREAGVATAAGTAGARAPAGPPLDAGILPAALAGLVTILPEPEPPPGVVSRTITITERAAIIRAALGHAPTIVLQDLLRGVRDRVVVAITFLAMLELMKRREIVVEQADPFGPITARRTTATERARAGVAAPPEAAPIDESLESFA
ncbi:MAG TPA: ScpA family protein [Candidatus Limnocylindrales bacterium]|nr:ScpA family protein [Candidatus Limnocylindrales bacterium]